MDRYQFNREKLEFTKVRLGLKTVLKRISLFVLGSIGLAVLYYLISDFSFFLRQKETCSEKRN